MHDKDSACSRQKVDHCAEKGGFIQIRKKGSHCFLKHPDGRCTVVPAHAGEIIGVGLLCQIMVDTEIDADILTELLRQ